MYTNTYMHHAPLTNRTGCVCVRVRDKYMRITFAHLCVRLWSLLCAPNSWQRLKVIRNANAAHLLRQKCILIKNAASSKAKKKQPHPHCSILYTSVSIWIFYDELDDCQVDINCVRSSFSTEQKKKSFTSNSEYNVVWWKDEEPATKVIFLIFVPHNIRSMFGWKLNVILELMRTMRHRFFFVRLFFPRKQASKWPLRLIHWMCIVCAAITFV